MKPATLALHCKSRNYRYDAKSNRYTVGNWPIGKSKREKLIGSNVILVPGIHKESYLGGTIVGFNQTSKTKCEVVFKHDTLLSGCSDAVSHKGWSNGRRSVCYI